jgi:hypothetical protein
MLNPQSNHDTEKAFYQLQQNGLLPTPTAMDSTNATATMKSSQVKEGSMHSVTLTRAMAMGMLPTPAPGTHGRGMHPHKGVVNALLKGEKPQIQELLVDRVFAMELEKMGVKEVQTFRGGMLPTPNSRDFKDAQTPEKYQERKEKWAEKGINLQLSLPQLVKNQMLPTPTVQDGDKATKKWRENHQNNLTAHVFNKMLPTPTCNDMTNACLPPSQINRNDSIVKRILLENPEAGKNSQLNPRFVLEMMGFPTDWTELPFLNGEMNPLKPEETP